MTRSRLMIAAIAALVGLVWTLQGFGVPIGGSFMIGDQTWAAIGLAVLVASITYAAWPRLRRR